MRVIKLDPVGETDSTLDFTQPDFELENPNPNNPRQWEAYSPGGTFDPVFAVGLKFYLDNHSAPELEGIFCVIEELVAGERYTVTKMAGPDPIAFDSSVRVNPLQGLCHIHADRPQIDLLERNGGGGAQPAVSSDGIHWMDVGPAVNTFSTYPVVVDAYCEWIRMRVTGGGGGAEFTWAYVV